MSSCDRLGSAVPGRGPVIHVITSLDLGGTELMLAKLLGAARRHEHIVVSLGGPGEVGKLLIEAGIRVVPLRLRNARGFFEGLPRLVRLIRRTRALAIHGWLAHGILVATAAQALARRPATLFWSVRQSLSDLALEKRSTRCVIRFNARWSRKPRAILYNSELGARQHEEIGYAPERTLVIPNGFDLARFVPDERRRRTARASLNAGEEDVIIGLIGRFHKTKNHGAFFEAAARILEKEPRARFLCAGNGVLEDNPDIVNLIGDPRLRKRLMLLGPRRDVADLNRALDIACNVSVGEGFSNAVGEAMACGTPCVVTDSGDSRTIVGDTGVVAASGAPDAIAAALLELVRAGKDRRRTLGLRARQRMEASFSLEVMVRRYEELYEEAMCDPQPASARS